MTLERPRGDLPSPERLSGHHFVRATPVFMMCRRERPKAPEENRDHDFGAPEAVAGCVEVPDVGAPGADEIVINVLAFPVNPADLSFCRGRYQAPPSLPATPGAECVGRVAAVGSGVTDMRPGDLVIHLQRENWVQRRRVAAADAIPLPADLDVMQGAMLRINPATALCLLEDLSASGSETG